MAALYPFAQALPQELQVPSMEPDFSFLQQQMMKANSLYESGLNEIKNDYSSVLNAPVSDIANIEKKQQYVANFRQGIKKLAGTDLSLPQNVLQAENLLSPFWQDQMLMQDTYWTKKLQGEFQKAETARTSDKSEIRDSFDEASLEPLHNDLERLKNAGRDPEFYRNFTPSSWTPFINLNKHINDWKEKTKPDISWQDEYYTDKDGNTRKVSPGHLVEHHNGPQSLPAYKTMIDSQVDSRFDAQFKVLGTNAYNSRLKGYMEQGMTREQARLMVAREVQPDILDKKKQYKDTVEATLNSVRSDLEALAHAAAKQPNGLTPTQVERQALLQSQLGILKDKYQAANSDFIEFSDPQKLNSMTDSYLISQLAYGIRHDAVNGYAKELSANTKSEIKEDTGYIAMQNINLRRGELAENIRYHNIEHSDKQSEQNIQMLKIMAENPEFAQQLQGPGAGQPSLPGMTVKRMGTEMLSNTKPYEIVEHLRDADRERVGNYLYGVPGVEGAQRYGSFSQLLKDPKVGLTSDELEAFNKYQWQHHNGLMQHLEDGRFIPQSKQDGQLYESALQKLCKATGINRSSLKTPDDVTNAMVTFGKNWVASNVNNATKLEEVKYYSDLFNNAEHVYTTLKNDIEEQNKNIAQKVATDPEKFKEIAVPDGKGGYRVINKRDIEPLAFDLEGIGENGQHYKFTRQDIATKYINGRVAVHTPEKSEGFSTSDPSIVIDGVTIHPTRVNGIDYQAAFDRDHTTRFGRWFHGEQGANPAARADVMNRLALITKKFGHSADIADGLGRVATETLPHSGYYESISGQAPIVNSIPIDGKFASNQQLIRDAVGTGNFLSIQDNKGNNASEENVQLLQKLANDKDVVKYLGKTIETAISDQAGTGKIILDIGKIDDNDEYKELSGKHFIVSISPDNKSDLLKRLPVAQDRERFDPLYDKNPDKNKVYTSALYQDMGVNITLGPSLDGRNFQIYGTYTDVDPDTGIKTVKNLPPVPIPRENGAAYARQIHQQMQQRAATNYMANLTAHNNKNGTK